MSTELKVTGKITAILEKITGEKRDGSGTWEKQTFVVNNGAEYNNIFAFEVFGEEKVANFNQYNKIGSIVDVKFNISTNEYQGKYYTNLQAWSVFKAELEEEKAATEPYDLKPPRQGAPVINNEEHDDLPF